MVGIRSNPGQHARSFWRSRHRTRDLCLVAQEDRFDVDLEFFRSFGHLVRQLGATTRLVHGIDCAADDNLLAGYLRAISQALSDTSWSKRRDIIALVLRVCRVWRRETIGLPFVINSVRSTSADVTGEGRIHPCYRAALYPRFYRLPGRSDYIIPFGRGARGGNYCHGRFRSILAPALELGSTASRAEEMGLTDRIAPTLRYELTAFFAIAAPAAVGSASSRYTFNGLSPKAWLGIVLGTTRLEVPRIHPVCI
jgi:hypothetical protein